MIPSSRALLSRDKRLPLDTWNQSRVQENVLGNQFSTFDSPPDFPQIISSENVHRNRGAVPHQPVETDKIMAQFQCRHLRQDRGLLVLQYLWNYRRTMWSVSKDSKCRNFNSLDSLLPDHSWCGRPDSKHRCQMVLPFRRQLCYGSKKWRWWPGGWGPQGMS